MEQYLRIKADYRDVLLLYRMGDFYETFYDDAKVLAKTIGIALTKRAHGKSADVPLAGFPYHALDNYLPKLVNAGLRVAICEQVEDPKLAKGVVKREVVEIASPGATLSDKLLDSRKNNFLLALTWHEDTCAIAVADVSTGSLEVSEFHKDQLLDQLIRYQPREILIAQKTVDELRRLTSHHISSIFTQRDDWVFNYDYCHDLLINHFRTHSLRGFGLDKMDQAVVAAGVVIHYLQENYKTRLEHFINIKVVNLSRFMVLDESTRRNLEISENISGSAADGTLLSVLDYTVTAMGARLFRLWLQRPLLSKPEIDKRLDILEALYRDNVLRRDLIAELKTIFDMERLLAKIVTKRAAPRDLLNLKTSLQALQPVSRIIGQTDSGLLKKSFSELNPLPELTGLIDKAIVDDPPLALQDGGIVRQGYHKELDELRLIADQGKDWLIAYQQKERKRTGISTLKISYNKVFGYYLEITNVHKNKVPADYIRKQTLVNAERYITPELKEWEEKILGAEDKINNLEYEIFQQLREQVSGYIKPIQENSRLIAGLDCHLSLAVAALENNYVRPQISGGDGIKIEAGRHPVVEKNLPHGEDFIANDVSLNLDDEQIWIITGPNMSGKSTFIRQVGLIVLMAQIGSFVPAASAEVGIVDRIFTRVGASDNLARGESTFLVEMNETANILNNASNKSLILLDEIGRGTSTFDGLSIAWAVAEYINNEKKVRSKTLFATHYHELTELALIYPRIKNYNVAVEEWEDQVVFLRKIVPGGTDNSYGIYVAQMAGLPRELIERAREILANLEANELSPHSKKPKLAARRGGRNVHSAQMNLFSDGETLKIKEALKTVDVNRITPLQALQKLDELVKMIKK